MEPHQSRKIAIHIRTPKRDVGAPVHKKITTEHTRGIDARNVVETKKQHEKSPVKTVATKPQRLSRWSRILTAQDVGEEIPQTPDEQITPNVIASSLAGTASTHEAEEETPRRQIKTESSEDLLLTKREVATSSPEYENPPTPLIRANAEALVPSKLIVPKKPIVMEGISMSALAIAYFCMEVALESDIPTYSGGLGVLAGDTLRSAADLKLNTIGVSLLYRKGYFHQYFDDSGWQIEGEEVWEPMHKLALLKGFAEIELEGRTVRLRAWMHKIRGESGHINPIIFLDTDMDGNTDEDRQITAKLYSGDRRMRLLQEAVLGIGGIRMLQKLGATNIQKFHMNEGHSAMLTLELYRQYRACDEPVEEVRRRAVFTTHTPIAAGHDVFTREIALSVLGDSYIPNEITHLAFHDGMLNMTHLGFNFSKYRNGVARKHGEVTRQLFPGYEIEAITNGVHVREWVSEPIAGLFDRYISGWRQDAYNLRYALSIPADELYQAHQAMKQELCNYVHTIDPHAGFDPQVFTIGFARRATAYKRGNLLFRDVERLKRIAEKTGGIQIVYAGKAHPDDREGKLMLQDVIRTMRACAGSKVRCVYLPNYNMTLAKLLVSGVDLWLNTPVRPMEASGTSGMKAALNGIPHFSTLDGWWLEGHIEGVTGWAIGPHPEHASSEDPDSADAEDLYTKLEYIILPRFGGDKHAWIKMMRSAIAINGSFFNTQRMLEQYVLGAYFV